MNDFLSQCRHLRFSTPSGSCKQTVSGNEGRTVAICEITCALIWTVCITFIEKIYTRGPDIYKKLGFSFCSQLCITADIYS